MISLKQHKKCDYPRTVKWLLDPEVRNSYGLQREINICSHVNFLKKNPNLSILGIYYRDLHVGNITIITRTKYLVELQIFLGNKRLWGKKLASKSIQVLLENTSKKIRLYVRCGEKKIIFYKRLGFIERKQLLCAHLHNNPDTVILQTYGRRND